MALQKQLALVGSVEPNSDWDLDSHVAFVYNSVETTINDRPFTQNTKHDWV